MGGFIYARKRRDGASGELHPDLTTARRVFEIKGLPLTTTLETDEFSIDVFGKHDHLVDNSVRYANGDFAVATGTLIYRDRLGKPALDSLYADFPASDPAPLDHCRGHFFALVYKGGRLHAFGDYQGLYHVFSNSDRSLVSNSFLAIAKTLPAREVSRQGIYEMIFYGASYGRSTILEGVELLPSRRLFDLGSAAAPTELGLETELPPLDYDERVRAVAEDLTRYFVPLEQTFGSEICAALSGGFDSRLLLTAMRPAGVAPQLYVYGSPSSDDVRLATALCEAEGREIEHIDRAALPRVEIDEWEESLRDTFYFFDGKVTTRSIPDRISRPKAPEQPCASPAQRGRGGRYSGISGSCPAATIPSNASSRRDAGRSIHVC